MNFDEKGCITPQALLRVVQGEEMSQLERLEISEHLSFCDHCLKEYSRLLTQETLMEPSKPLADHFLKRLKKKVERLVFRRVTAAALAAGFALAFVFSDAFVLTCTQFEREERLQVSQTQEEGERWMRKMTGWWDGWIEQIFSSCDGRDTENGNLRS